MNAPFPGYAVPHDTLTQNLDNTVVPAINRMNPVLMGVQYLLSIDDGRVLVGSEFSTGTTDVAYQYTLEGSVYAVDAGSHVVDLNSVELIANQLEARVSGITSSGSPVVVSDADSPYRLRFSDGLVYSSTGATLVDHLDGRAIVPGDVLKVTSVDNGNSLAYCTVTGYIPKVLTPAIGSVVKVLESGYGPAVTRGSSFYGTLDNTFVITVTSVTLTTVTATIHDTAGLYALQTVTWGVAAVKDLYVEGVQPTGLVVTVDESVPGYKSVAGNTYTVSVTNAGLSSTAFDGVTIDTPAYLYGYTGDLTADVLVRVNGKLTTNNTQSGSVATVAEDKVTYVGTNLGVYRSSLFCPFINARGTVEVAFRAAQIAGTTESPILINPGDDLTQFGEYNSENTLAYGIRAMQAGAETGGNDNPIYVVRVSDDTTAAYADGLRKLRSSDLFYAIAALTDDVEVAKVLRTDVLSSSGASSMKWRKGYVGFDSPGEYVVWGEIPETGNFRKATLVNGLVTVDVGDRDHGDFISASIRAGDLVKFTCLPDSLVVASVLAGNDGQSWQLRVTGATSNVIVSNAFTVSKPDSAENIADFITALAAEVGGTLGDGRMTLLWGDAVQTALAGSGQLPNKFMAAWCAGFRCNLYPQQGMATYEVPIALSAPSMHTKFEPSLLNEMCSKGVMVITQDTADTPVYVLGQVTTCTSGGLAKFQDNIRVIADDFSYAIKDGQIGLKGRKNASKVTAAAIAKKTLATCINACQVPLDEHQIAGPRVMAFYDRDGNPNQVTVERSTDFVNRIATYVQIDVAPPLNGIDNVLRLSIGTTF